MSPFSGSDGTALTGEHTAMTDCGGAARVGAVRAYLYDADGNDQECQLDAADVDALGENQFLWVDVDGGDDEVRAVGRVLALDGETMAALLDGSRDPSLFVHEDYFQVNVTAVQGEAHDYRTVLLDCVAGRNWVLTSHQEPVEFLEDFDDRFRGESNVGQFGSAGFLSALLTEHLLTYSRQLEPTVKEIDHLEQLVLRDRVDEGKAAASARRNHAADRTPAPLAYTPPRDL
jgi:magnesium transporter